MTGFFVETKRQPGGMPGGGSGVVEEHGIDDSSINCPICSARSATVWPPIVMVISFCAGRLISSVGCTLGGRRL